MNAYSTKQAADNLGISTSTLRKWCLLLEKEEYIFDRNENNNRIFYDTDLLALRHIKKLTQEEGRTLENAAKDVSTKGRARKSITHSDMDDKSEITDDIAVTTRHDGYKINQLLELVERQNEVLSRQEERIDRLDRFNRELLMELKNQSEKERREKEFIIKTLEEIKERDVTIGKYEKYIEEKLENRDKQFTEIVREIHDTKRLITASNEEKKKGFFSKLFGTGKN
ncbi:DUF3967 domain-containing protein [Priestia endophytica]|uniref:DUF3967 domain-containing protein n=1 Tax=Priestia endophytica TaxID=135735 RepID=UPI00124D9DB4|nr:DUF3967 domain-containing protein [Priestia endophytica]KAB2486561.1 MerR family transcriptional regulator [Priestia endophytica]